MQERRIRRLTAAKQQRKVMRIKNAGITREELPFDCVHYESSGCVITVVVRDDKSEVINKLSYMNPILMEEIPIDFEDMFIEKVRERGYAVCLSAVCFSPVRLVLIIACTFFSTVA